MPHHYTNILLLTKYDKKSQKPVKIIGIQIILRNIIYWTCLSIDCAVRSAENIGVGPTHFMFST